MDDEKAHELIAELVKNLVWCFEIVLVICMIVLKIVKFTEVKFISSFLVREKKPKFYVHYIRRKIDIARDIGLIP